MGLAQHEEMLEWKIVESVTIFWSGEAVLDMNRWCPGLGFRMVDVGGFHIAEEASTDDG
jgi:hypothetical protein